MRISFIIASIVSLMLIGAVAAAGVVGYGLWHYGRNLPDYGQLARYEPPVMTRVHAADGLLVAEYARERRLFVPINVIPKQVINAFLAAEDRKFYEHNGIDLFGIVRAVVTNIRNLASNRRPVGASTITQQVAKNFLLTNEVSFKRKIKEAILALRIERAFRKNKILELYLNEIYLGGGNYGVAAAALNYFDKSLDELTVEEAAYLAALPKAPNNYHPIRNRERATGRRNWVIERMVATGAITESVAAAAKTKPLIARPGGNVTVTSAEWYTEEVRRELARRDGESRLYGGGLSVRTSLDPTLQAAAQNALRAGLEAYDRRHGFRGPVGQISTDDGWPKRLAAVPEPRAKLPDWRLAVVIEAADDLARIGFADGDSGAIPLTELTWARAYEEVDTRGPEIEKASDVVAPGDVILVAAKADGAAGEYSLKQIPKINGAIVALDPHTGRLLAMVGGWRYGASQFNRSVQAHRQPGSAFKPFVYAAALDSGFTPASIVLDAPFVIDQGEGQGKWKPANYTRKFYGPSTLRLGIEKSRNLMTVRLAQQIGMGIVADYADRFGITREMPPQLAMALGAGETTLLKLTAAYAMLVNGGKRIEPRMIDRVQDRFGKTIYRTDTRVCDACGEIDWQSGTMPSLPDIREPVIDQVTAYQVVSMLQGVIQRGTGRRIAVVKHPLGGKTGTSNESRDSWFVGFSADLAVGVYTGFDEPASLGRKETGSSVAAPIFRDFMAAALAEETPTPFRVPVGVRLVKIDAVTGELASRSSKSVILEAFRPGTEPSRKAGRTARQTRRQGTTPAAAKTRRRLGTGGLY